MVPVTRAFLLGVVLAALAACSAHPAPDVGASSGTSGHAAAPSAAAPSAAAPSAAAPAPDAPSATAPTAPPAAASPPGAPSAAAPSSTAPDPGAPSAVPSAAPALSWLGVPVDPSIKFARTVHRDLDGWSEALQVPEAWTGRNTGDREQDTLTLVKPPDKFAVVILMEYVSAPIWEESVVAMGVDSWLHLSGGVTSSDWDSGIVGRTPRWDPPTPIAIGAKRTTGSQRLGKGLLWGRPAKLWMIRRRFPSVETGKHGLIVTGALRDDAPPARQAEFFACLSTFSPTPE